ncbi:CMP-N-acetylneuraminate-beta-galactosamide-alpha-2,3-sialyltransferase 4 isoform X5 [Hypomesus transpacificus]|uniref:CMP-N-acetylneuraminate-beta-galactosamide- alpha-2,3-sialyltransferase 4 isoform X5 n=1 Tax=Hypomesus transpacificus TaxID=137520 RepID=UPI001F071893|nr:CMP-N-acetylneuraminate-beta-galactosamide-alpha-2,3-sialyltransferase 4 isoform X5 [Hypomesus transpacificus]
MKEGKAWCLRLLPVVLFFVSYYCSYVFQRYGAAMEAPARLLLRARPCVVAGCHRRSGRALTLKLLLLKVLAVVANYKMPANIENLECRTCVVIGNGYAIKNSSLGGVINKYDVVIRLNDAPVKGYEDDVGNKTTMRLFYPESASYNPGLHNEPDTLMVLIPFKQQDLRWLKEILYDEKRVRKGFWKPPPQIWLGSTSHIRVLDPHFLLETSNTLLQIPLNPKNKQKLVHPTTGIIAVFVALNYCDVVHIAGFGYPVAKNQKHPIHYYGYDTMKSMKNSYHDVNNEAEALRRLEDSGAIVYLHAHS